MYPSAPPDSWAFKTQQKIQWLSKEKPFGANQYVLQRLFPYQSELGFPQKNLGSSVGGKYLTTAHSLGSVACVGAVSLKLLL